MTEAFSIYLSLIANCVVNVFLCCTTVMLNIVTIHALRKALLLPQPLKILLLSLSVSDLGVGLLVQPLYITFLVMRIEQNIENNQTHNLLKNASDFAGRFLVFASFLDITALSADRFLAIHLHLRYQELVTHKRVVVVAISVWLFSGFISILHMWVSFHVTFVIFAGCVLSTTYFYCKIYLAVRRHTNQIQALQVQQVAENGDAMANAARLRKSAVATFYMYLVLLACYLPFIIVKVAIDINTGLQITLAEHLLPYTVTLLHLHSSLNPFIYSWKLKHIKYAVMNTLQNVCPSHN